MIIIIIIIIIILGGLKFLQSSIIWDTAHLWSFNKFIVKAPDKSDSDIDSNWDIDSKFWMMKPKVIIHVINNFTDCQAGTTC